MRKDRMENLKIHADRCSQCAEGHRVGVYLVPQFRLGDIRKCDGNHPVPDLFLRDENPVFLNQRPVFNGRTVIQRQENIRFHGRRIDRFFADPDGITVLASPDSGFEFLPGEYGITVPRDGFRKNFPDGLHAFTGRAGDDHIQVLHHVTAPFISVH